MSIKLALLKSGEQVIADIKELLVEEKVCGYYFLQPHRVRLGRPVLLTEEQEVSSDSVEVTLSPWILISKDNQMAVSSDWVVTIVEPIRDVKEMYLEKINESSNKVSSIEE